MNHYYEQYETPFEAFWEKLGLKLTSEVEAAFRRHYDPHPLRFMPHVETTIRQLSARGVRLGIITASQNDYVSGLLELHGLRAHFSAIVIGTEVKTEAILDFIRVHELNPDQTYFVEDSPYGVADGHRAGVRTIGYTGQFGHDRVISRGRPHYTIGDHREILKIIV